MNKVIRIGLFGLFTWLIPFLVSFLFYSKEGGLTIDIFLFKSIMIVVGSLAGACLLLKYFKKIKKDYVLEGATVGIIGFIINISLDVLVLLPMSKIPFNIYFAQIGLRYLVLPIMSIAMGMAIEKK